MFTWYRRYRRQCLLAQPYPEGWALFLERNVADYHLLNEGERSRLRNDARILVAEKNWEGCHGLEVTDEVKVTIAAQACLMVLGLDQDHFSRVLSILVYLSSFAISHEGWPDEKGKREALAGQAVYRGPVILAWDAVIAEARDPATGRNVVIHEFAHQLDFLDDTINGTPDLGSSQQARRWQEVMTIEYSRLQRAIRKGHKTYLGDYAARNETEFFAVASERFFTQPGRLRHYHAALYEVLGEYYRVEPVRWFAGREGSAQTTPEVGDAPAVP
jgi:Mlc titration factor MtfA (ptsG expression regulator)